MKLDKEWILKHRFWLLLGTFGLLFLVALITLFAIGGGPIDAAKKAFDDAVNGIKPYASNSGPTRPKNDFFLPKWVDYGATFKDHKNTVWNLAWKGDASDPPLKAVDDEVKNKAPEDPKILARHVFRNATWEVTLLFDRGGPDQAWRVRPDSSIKNIDEDGLDQDLGSPANPDGVWFRLRQGNAAALIAFEGPPVPPDQKRTLAEGKHKDDWLVKDADPTQAMQLEQVVDQHWQGQAVMYTWPADLNKNPLYPADPFETKDLERYKGDTESNSPYRRQFVSLYSELKSNDAELKALGLTRAPLPPTKGDADVGFPAPTTGPKTLDSAIFRGGDLSRGDYEAYLAVLKPVEINAKDVKSAPTAEECWLMQEDFWVKREVLRVVRDAMSLAAHMDAVEPPADMPDADPKIEGRRTFRNASWEVTLLFDRPDGVKWRVRPDSSIKNVHVSHRDQDLGNPASPGGVWFRLRQGDPTKPAPEDDSPPQPPQVGLIAFEGERLAWQQRRTLAEGRYKDGGWVLPGKLDLTKPLRLEQVFDATNTPITDIGAIAISKVSHKNANRLLTQAKPERYGQKPAAPADSKTAGAPGATAAAAPPGPGGTGGGMPPGPGGSSGGVQAPPNGAAGAPGQTGAGTAATTNLTPNYKIDRNRYLFVTDQSRHLPLAVTLTVDQSHLHEVLAAFANSRLRFQTTQVEFRRVPAAAFASSSTTSPPNGFVPDNTNPNPGGTGKPLSQFTPTTGPPGPGGTGRPSSPGGMNPNGMNPNDMNPNGAATNLASAEGDNPNLIEVTIYGIASLYERPPNAK